MNAHVSTSKVAAHYHGEMREPGGLGSNPHSANKGWAIDLLCVFLLEMTLDLWSSNFYFSSGTHSSNKILSRTSISRSDGSRGTLVGRGLGPGRSASLGSSEGSSEEPQSAQNTT